MEHTVLKDWLATAKFNSRAFCKICKKTIELSNMCKKAPGSDTKHLEDVNKVQDFFKSF